MSRLFVLLLIVAAFTGTYWTVMSGYAAQRMIAVDIRAAARENDPVTILDRLRDAEKNFDSQKQWVERFSFLATNPDWSQVNASRKMLRELQKEAGDVVKISGGEVGSEGTEQLRRYLRNMEPLTAQVFRAGEDTLWKVLFWFSAGGMLLTGMLNFIRRAGG